MKVLGILNNKLCLLIEGARIIIELKLSNSNLNDIIDYTELPVFNSYTEVEEAAYGNNREQYFLTGW